MVPFTLTVRTASRCAPPSASPARLTRLCSRVCCAAQAASKETARTASVRFMVFLPGMGAMPTALLCHYSAHRQHATFGLKIATLRVMPRKLNLMRTDRIGYVVGGLALIAWAARRPSWPKAAAAGFGAWLVYQAYTGSNPMFKPLGPPGNRQPAPGHTSEPLAAAAAGPISRPPNGVYG